MPVLASSAELGGNTACRICVVGSGPAGALLAVELARAGHDVMVLEAGNETPCFELDATCAAIKVEQGQDIKFGFSRQLGGASNLWSGRCAPFENIDFIARPEIPHTGWPFPRAALDDYYQRAAAILGLPGVEAASHAAQALPSVPALGNSLQAFLKQGGISLKSFQWARKPFNAGAYLRAAAADLANLRVVLDTPVAQLVDDKQGRIIAVVTGPGTVIAPDYVVLAAGGLETPRILLNSPSLAGHAIGNAADNVGRYLSTHPKADMATLTLTKAIPADLPLVSDQVADEAAIRFGLGLTAETLQAKGLLNHYVQLLPILEYQANKAFEAVKGQMADASPLIERSKLVRGLLPGIGLMVFELLGRVAKLQRKARRFILRGFLDQVPDRDNRVMLADATDRNGQRKMVVQWRYSDHDRANVLAFFDELAANLTASGAGQMDYDRLKMVKDWPLTGIHSHFMGTTRMGGDPATSVTNADGRVHSAPNLYISGPSLFPTYGYANPVFTIAALALRMADHLKIRLGE